MSDYGSDYEHGWNESPFHGQNIMTCVRDQGGRPTCIFHALCAAYEIDFRRLLALEKESMSTDFLFNVKEFIREFEETYGETKEMDTVKTDRIDKDEDGSCSSSDDDMTEDRSSSEEEKSNDEMNGSDDEDEETPKKLVVCKRVAETALKESVSHKKAKSLASDKEAKIAAPSGCKTGDKKGVETHSTKKVNQAPANS